MFPPFLRPSFGNLLLLYHKNIITILQASDDGGGDIFTPFSLCSNVFRSVEGKSILLPVLVVMLNEKPALQQPLTLLSMCGSLLNLTFLHTFKFLACIP